MTTLKVLVSAACVLFTAYLFWVGRSKSRRGRGTTPSAGAAGGSIPTSLTA